MRLEPFRQKRKAVLHAERQKRKMELPAFAESSGGPRG